MNCRSSLAVLSVLLLSGSAPDAVPAEEPSVSPSSTPLAAEDLVKIAVSANPQVRAAKAQYEAALHQIDQAYTPQDPQLSIQKTQTPNNFSRAQTQSVGISESFQFPGKAWLQGNEAHRNAEISRLVYMAAARDARAQALTAYYQTELDSAAVSIGAENTASIGQVLQVVKVAYSASQAAQSDLISAELSLAQSSQTVRVSRAAEANDEAALNQALGREPETPINLADGLELEPLGSSLAGIKEKALAMRQEILEAALTEKNSKTALKLAWMELLPDYNISWMRSNYPRGSINTGYGINPIDGTQQASHDFSTALTFNVPVFAWFHQKEDIRSASNLLEAARQNRKSVENQTLTSVVQLFRSTDLAYQTAQLNKNLLIPLAYQNFRVALVAYQSKKVDFLTLSNALQGIYNARINYLTAANQFLAGRVALEQAIGAHLK